MSTNRIIDIGQPLFRRLMLLLGLFMVLFIVSSLFLVIANDQEKHDAYIIGSASLQQTLEQQYAREISVVIAAHAISDWDTLFTHAGSAQQTEDLIEQTFRGFAEGGKVNISRNGKHFFSVQPIQDPHLRKLLNQAWQEWSKLKRLSTVTLQADVSSIVKNPGYDVLSNQVDISTRACDQFVQALQQQGVKARERLIFCQILNVLLGSLLLLAILVYVRQKITTPLVRATQALWLKDRALEASSSGIIITDPHRKDNPIVYCNPQFEAMTGYDRSEIMDQSYTMLLGRDNSESVLKTLRSAFEQGTSCILALKNVRKDGTPFWIELTLSPVHDDISGQLINFICIQNDITERKNLERQLFHAQKLESIGHLAAGVAHEINNPIGFVMSNQHTLKSYFSTIEELLQFYDGMLMEKPEGKNNLELVQEKIETLKEEKEISYILNDMKDILEENRVGLIRVRDIVKGLKTFARDDDTGLEELDINTVLEYSIKMTWNELRYKAELVRHLSPVPPILGNAGQLSQVFINLLVNAVQAMAEPGDITIETFQEGDVVRVKISDTGLGIPEENLVKIMDPFFTTKPVGEGTGLGLSISFEIIKQHRGEIHVESQVGKGTTFTISLPVSGISTKPNPSQTMPSAQSPNTNPSLK